MVSIQIAFALEFFLADAVRFVPVDFRHPDPSARETYGCHALHLAPATFAVLFSKAL